MQEIALPDRDEAVEPAERRGGREDLDAEIGEAAPQCGGLGVPALPEHPATEGLPLVREHHVRSLLGGRDRRVQARPASAHDQNVRVAGAVIGPRLALAGLRRQPAEARGPAQPPLIERPEPARSHEGLVVEARGSEARAEPVDGPHRVEGEARPRVHVPDLHSLAKRLGAGPHARRAVDLDQAVRALPGAAEQPARAVVLEGAREDPLAGAGQGGGDRVALEPAARVPVEAEADLPAAANQLTGALGQPAPAHDALAPPDDPAAVFVAAALMVSVTAPRRVSRFAISHRPQPEE